MVRSRLASGEARPFPASFTEHPAPKRSVEELRDLWFWAARVCYKIGAGLIFGNGDILISKHWVEVIDQQHRSGSDLCHYHLVWRQSSTRQSFLYWLDHGEGKLLDLESCPRKNLNKGNILYCRPSQSARHLVTIENGLLRYAFSGELVQAPTQWRGIVAWKRLSPADKARAKAEGRKPDYQRWICVMSCKRIFYVGLKRRGLFQHSSFLAGAATLFAGLIEVVRSA